MRVVRNNIWETNSSSSHTVTIRGMKNLNEHYKTSSAIIEVKLDEYGWSGDPCDDFYSKLAYALSMVLHTEYPGFDYWDDRFVVDQDILEECAGYQSILKAIQGHFNCCDRIVIRKRIGAYYPYGYIGHQSYEDYGSLQDFLDDWNVDIERFLFDDGVTVWISNDNG